MKKECVVRTKETGDKVYLLKEEKRHWIENPQTLESLGYGFGDVVGITFDALKEYEEGHSIDHTHQQQLVEDKKEDDGGKKEFDVNAVDKKPVLNYRRN